MRVNPVTHVSLYLQVNGQAEKALCQYAYSRAKNEEALASFHAIMEELIAMYDALSDKDNFDTYLGEMYAFYLNQYQLLKSEAEA